MTGILGVVLTGGRSSRFGENKVHAKLHNQTLLRWVIDTVLPQVATLRFSGTPIELSSAGIEGIKWIPDREAGHPGPLVATLSCLEYLRCTDYEWLLTTPCDTPFLPKDLACKLMQTARANESIVAVAGDEARLHPAHALWHRDAHDVLLNAVSAGVRGFHEYFDSVKFCSVKWATSDHHFFNINTQQDLNQAEKMRHNLEGAT